MVPKSLDVAEERMDDFMRNVHNIKCIHGLSIASGFIFLPFDHASTGFIDIKDHFPIHSRTVPATSNHVVTAFGPSRPSDCLVVFRE